MWLYVTAASILLAPGVSSQGEAADAGGRANAAEGVHGPGQARKLTGRMRSSGCEREVHAVLKTAAPVRNSGISP